MTGMLTYFFGGKLSSKNLIGMRWRGIPFNIQHNGCSLLRCLMLPPSSLFTNEPASALSNPQQHSKCQQ